MDLFGWELEMAQGIGMPKYVLVALPVEAAIGGNAANVAGGLEFFERHRKCGREPFLFSELAQIADGFAAGFAEAVGIERAFLQHR
jgi:hypothetical protein